MVCWQLNYIIFEPYIIKTSVFTFLCLKYAACSFIRGETCLGLFATKLGSSQRYCIGKRFSASFQRVRLIFISFCSKERCHLSLAKLFCFQHYVSENRLFLVFLRKLCFWPFILSKTCFGVLEIWLDVSSILFQKVAISFFASEYPSLSLIVAEIRFLYVGKKIALLWVLYHKKSVYAENFFLFNKPEFKFYGKQIKTCILCYKAEYNVFSNEKEKGCFVWSKFQSSPILLQTNQNMFSVR